MNQPEFTDFLPLFDEANRLYLHGDLVGALALATEGQQRFPESGAPLYYLRATLRARMGDTTEALELLAEAMEKGYWYPDGRWASDAFSPLHQIPEFVRLRNISNAREIKAIAETKPELTLILPNKSGPDKSGPDKSGPTSAAPKSAGLDAAASESAGQDKSSSNESGSDKDTRGDAGANPALMPLLMALHSNGFSMHHAERYWQPAVGKGWALALPQSGQIIGYDAYAWGEHATTESELIAHITTIRQRIPVDAGQVVFAGKSQGAETAIRLALSGVIRARGFIAIVPSGAMMLHSSQWEELVQHANRDLRGYVLIGGREAHFAAGGRRLVEMLRARGIACALDYHPGVRHEFPLNFRARLAFMLDFVSGKHED